MCAMPLTGSARSRASSGLHVDPRRRQDRIGERPFAVEGRQIGLRAGDDPAQQRITVRMRARRRQAEEHVTGDDRRTVDDRRLLDDADGKAGQIVLAVRIHARHFGRFAADQRAAGQFAAPGDALDDLGAVSTSSLPQAK
jgi:hypothetical protein